MAEPYAAGNKMLVPWPRSRLLGRRDEVAFARSALLEDGAPLLSLTGPGGVGKTRLALAIGHEVGWAFADGVFWVDLAPVSDPELVTSAVLSAIGLTPAAEQPGILALKHHLRMRQCLLLLDNCEHIVAAAAELASKLLASCPGVQCLATSRAPLRIRGEVEQVLDPLPLPALDGETPEDLGENEAVALFVERSRAVRPEFSLNHQNAPSIAALCRRLDGLPLAIELAAARSRILSPEALLAQMTDRLRLLRGGTRDAPPRQQTLEATMTWSYALLDAEAQTLFQRLAVCVDGCDVEAAAALAGNDAASVIDGLSALREQGLLRVTEREPGHLRYGMLETIREFAQARLDESGAAERAREAHAAYFLDLVEEADRRLKGPAQAPWLKRLGAEYGNALAALDWFIALGDAQRAWQMAGALWYFWKLQASFADGRRRLEAALAVPGERHTAAWARAQTALGYMIVHDFHDVAAYSAAHMALEQALRVWQDLEDRRGEATALEELMTVHFNQGDLVLARSCGEDALAIYRDLESDHGIFNALWILGVVSLKAGDFTRSHAELDEAMVYAHNVGPDFPGFLARPQGWLAAAEGDFARATRLIAARLADNRDDENHNKIASWQDDLGWLALEQGDIAGAAGSFAEELAIGVTLNDEWYMARGIVGLAVVATRLGRPEQAAWSLGVADGIMDFMAIDDHPYWSIRPLYDRAIDDLRRALGADALADERQSGRVMPRHQAISRVLADAAAPVTSLDRRVLDTVAVYERLTAREAEVLGLIARRMTDSEIADALFISRRTVGSHVARILEKLGATNRREAGALAARMGIV